jgi:PII-like signaling protein
MTIEGAARRVTIYVGSQDTWHGKNLAAAIVERCRSMGLAGATLTRGIMGFGKNSRIHRAHLLGLSDDLPERIEVIDRPDRIDALLPALDEMVGGGLIVVEDVRVVRYGADTGAAAGPR